MQSQAYGQASAASDGDQQSSAAQEWLYSVRPGDTLWGLCEKYTHKRNCWLELGPHNGVKFPRQLPPGLIIRFPIAWLKQLPTPVLVADFSGEVFYQLPNSQEKTQAANGVRLAIGTEITTGVDSLVKLRFDDGSEMQIEPNSRLILRALSADSDAEYVEMRTYLHHGAVQTRVPERQPKSRFEITTPAAIAAVRGTEFRVASANNPQGTAVMLGEVYEGAVAVANEQSTDAAEVKAGFGIKAEQGQAISEPEPLPPAPQLFSFKAAQKAPITITWQAMPGVSRYRFEVFSQADTNETLAYVGEVSAQEFSDTLMQFTQGCYRIAVRAISDSGLLGLASEAPVCVSSPLSTPLLDNSKIRFPSKDSQLALSWQAVALAQSYRIEVAEDKNFTQGLQVFNSETSSFSLNTNTLPGSRYYYRVVAESRDQVNSDASLPGELKKSDEPWAALTGWSIFWILVGVL